MKRHLALVGLLLAAAGCGAAAPGHDDASAAASNDNSVTVTATDEFRFTPGRVTVNAGDVTLRLDASGIYPHNIAFPRLRVTSTTVGTAPGDARSTTVRLHDPHRGVYRFVCTFHSKAGMTGELIVE